MANERKREAAKKVLNKILSSDKPGKKYMAHVRDPEDPGDVDTVYFGDPNMTIKRQNPARRKSFNARHNCDEADDKTTPKYWSCKAWKTSTELP